MAEIFRPTYTVTDPETGKRVKRKSRTWHARYYTPDGQRHRVKGYRDKRATEALAAQLERRGIRVDAGLVDPADVHAKRPLTEHAEDFRRYLTAKGNTPAYIDKALSRLTVVLDRCRFVKIADVQPSAVQECLATLRGDGKSIKTANDYLDAAKGFTRWLWRDRRTVTDPLASLSRLSHGETDVRHARRDFTPEELQRLLEAARASSLTLRRLNGVDRYFLYLTACATGFRASELASLTPESFDLNGEPPTATVQAGCTKNRQTACQPLPRDIADALRPFLARKPAGVSLWPG
jgi:site-specific recombinase XerD